MELWRMNAGMQVQTLNGPSCDGSLHTYGQILLSFSLIPVTIVPLSLNNTVGRPRGRAVLSRAQSSLTYGQTVQLNQSLLSFSAPGQRHFSRQLPRPREAWGVQLPGPPVVPLPPPSPLHPQHAWTEGPGSPRRGSASEPPRRASHCIPRPAPG